MIRESAPAKVNLVLQVGSRRADGLHPICSLFASVELGDELTISHGDGEEDVVVCPGVEGPNLVAEAIRVFRKNAACELPPLRVEIDKRTPVAAGLGGGSADAAAALRAANELAGRPLDLPGLMRLGAGLGADVPSQVAPGHALVTGAGETVEPLSLPAFPLVLVPQPAGLSTASVYAEADRIGSPRERLDPDAVRRLASGGSAALAEGLENDLEPAAITLRPELVAVLGDLRTRGALAARVTGSGPTVFGLFADRGTAERAAARTPAAILTAVRSSRPRRPVRPGR